MKKSFESLVGTAGRPASVAELEAELSALWRSAAEDPETRHAVLRSCALTLVVYVEDEAAGREVNDLISEVMRENPCRAIVVTAERDAAPAGLSARISARCTFPAAGEKEICCEQVMITARGEAIAGLDHVVIPLMVPGLPVYLWWRAGRFSPPPSLRPILRAASRVLVDSATFPEPQVGLQNFSGHVRELAGEVIFTDLNWGRLTPWRELVAQCFDSVETRPYLDRLTEVQIEYEDLSNGARVQRGQSLLLAGWLASRLGWEPARESVEGSRIGQPFLLRAGGRSIRIECRPRRCQTEFAGTCVSVALKSGGDSPAEFSLARGSGVNTATTRMEISGRPPIERVVRLEPLEEVRLVNEEIKFAGRDRVYEEALAMVAGMTAPGA